jgi:hypothetical protein
MPHTRKDCSILCKAAYYYWRWIVRHSCYIIVQ